MENYRSLSDTYDILQNKTTVHSESNIEVSLLKLPQIILRIL